MKVALVSDYIREYGGAERVLEVFHEIWPEAPIYTLIYLPEFLGPHRQRLRKWDVRPLISPRTPFLSKMTSLSRLIAPLLFAKLDLSEYDFVIVSATGAYTPNFVKTRPGTHFCYCHTPPRYLYGYLTAREWKKYWWVRIPAEVANHFLRLLDFRAAQKVDFFIANSKNIARRIEKFYRKDSVVIYPPVEIGDRVKGLGSGKKKKFSKPYTLVAKPFFLTGGRLARAKRIDLAVKACSQLGLPLKVFGRVFADYGEELKKMAGPTVEFMGEVSDKELADLYTNSRAFIFPAEEEDFGIAPVEAMSFGKPVIAYRSGGVVESVIEGKTGVFFNEPTAESLSEAIKRLDNLAVKAQDCINQAHKFSKERFEKEIRAFVSLKSKK